MHDDIDRPLWLDNSVGYLLRRNFKLGVALVEPEFVGEELSFTQWVALMHMHAGKVDTPGGIARSLDNDSGATTRMIDQLERSGMLTRRRDTVDRRVILLSLTENGQAVTERLLAKVDAVWDDVLQGMPADDVERLRDLLRRLAARLDGVTEAGAA